MQQTSYQVQLKAHAKSEMLSTGTQWGGLQLSGMSYYPCAWCWLKVSTHAYDMCMLKMDIHHVYMAVCAHAVSLEESIGFALLPRDERL